MRNVDHVDAAHRDGGYRYGLVVYGGNGGIVYARIGGVLSVE